jgi:hypothetical protein
MLSSGVLDSCESFLAPCITWFVPSLLCPQGPPKAVLPEEDYTAHINAIIERDFFPDIPKLRSQMEWEQAVASGDPQRIRQAQVGWWCPEVCQRLSTLLWVPVPSHYLTLSPPKLLPRTHCCCAPC